MIQFLKELYLTVFVLGYRFNIAGGWAPLNPRLGVLMDQTKGAFAVSIIVILTLAGIEMYVQFLLGRKFAFDDSLLDVVAALAIYFVNLHLLVTRGHGVRFEREFNNLKKSRKILLVTVSITLMLAGVAFALYVRSVYLRFFYGVS